MSGSGYPSRSWPTPSTKNISLDLLLIAWLLAWANVVVLGTCLMTSAVLAVGSISGQYGYELYGSDSRILCENMIDVLGLQLASLGAQPNTIPCCGMVRRPIP